MLGDDISENINILLVDDHPLIRQGIARLINKHQGYFVCGEAGDAEEAMTLLKSIEVDVIILDISMKGISGIELTKNIKNLYPEIKIIIFSMHDEKLFCKRALQVGARGYVMKHEPPETILKAIETVLEGSLAISNNLKKDVLQKYFYEDCKIGIVDIQNLSDREFETFQMLGKGISIKNIAVELDLSKKTIETYRDRMKTKFEFANSNELVIFAAQWCLTSEWLCT